MKVTKISETRKSVYRVAAYCRVSTSLEDQQESFATQCRYYTDLINSTPSWEMVGIYADEGRSGTSAEHRPQFMKMIEDARAGKMNLILVKSISRFGRNAGECQRYARELKTYCVEVRFEKEGLSNMDPSADFLFSVLAITAQEESRFIRENVRWTYKKNFEQGVYHMGNHRMLGFDMGSDGKMVPNGDAWIIRRAFEDYAGGMNLTQTAATLNKSGAHRLRSDKPFDADCIDRILHNEAYVGNLHMQKRPPTDYLTKRPMENTRYTIYLVKNDHEGIVDRGLWEAVKKKLDSADKDLDAGLYRSKTQTHFLYGIVYCSQCGSPMMRRMYMDRKNKYKAWNCCRRQHGSGCTNPAIRETELMEEIENALEERWIATDGDIEDIITKNISRVDVGAEEIKISFTEEEHKIPIRCTIC